ncbi:MAG: gliding motility lipoprotein GldH [Muribaculaceae bacterium]|nr:gliding motility lipoprotein GldH [Muribaculaceae bacterium]
MNRFIPAIVSVCLLALVGCGDRNEFVDYVPVGESGWAYGDTIRLITHFDDQLASGELSVNVRHDTDYLFQNLWLEVTYMNGRNVCRDTVNIVLADKFGNWQGDGFGARYQQSAVVRPSVTMADSSTVTIRHIMRVDTLRNVEQIGLTFNPSSK